MRYSNHCKIIDKESEYYGQVFEVETINIQDECIWAKCPDEFERDYDFSQIQFCVTKDKTDGTSEPVKIGEEYLCLGDGYGINKIENFYETKRGLFLVTNRVIFHIDEINEFESLHPTNKIKITAEKIEELERGAIDNLLVLEKINELIRAINKLTNTTN